MKVTTAVINKISTFLDILENDMSICRDILLTTFFDIFVVFRHVVTTLKDSDIDTIKDTIKLIQLLVTLLKVTRYYCR